MNLEDVRQKIIETLAGKCTDPRRQATSILSAITGLDRTACLLQNDYKVSEFQQAFCYKVVERFLKGEPLSRIFQKRDFWKHTFLLSPHTLDPRPDSEVLIETALSFNPTRILDLGTGSGCLLLSLLSECPQAQGVGVDQSYGALSTAQKNAYKLNLSNRVHFVNTWWTKGLKGCYDLIISNPPYIQTNVIPTLHPIVKTYDPWLALDGGEDGLNCYQEIAAIVRPFLTDCGYIIVEIGQDQEKDVTAIFEKHHFYLIDQKKDLSKIIRVLIFKKI